MPRKIEPTLLGESVQLRLHGAHRLPVQFRSVVRPYQPPGRAAPLFLLSDSPRVVTQKCLSFLSEHVLQSSFPRRCGILLGDAAIFQRPPSLRSTRATRKDAVCLCLSTAESAGLTKQGRYRALLLGYDAAGVAVRIGAHRLVCWAVHGPYEEGKRRRRVAAHATKNCPPSGLCINPLHLRWETDRTNRIDREIVREQVMAQAVNNLSSSQEEL